MATALAPYDGFRSMPATIDHQSGVQHRPSSGLFDLIKTYRRHLMLFLLVAGAIMLATAAYTFLQTPRYRAEATLVIAPRAAEVGADRTTALSDPAADSSVDTQVELLRSRTLAARVVERLRLTEPERFRALMHVPSTRDRIPGLARAPEQMPGPAARSEAAIERLRDGLRVARTPGVRASGPPPRGRHRQQLRAPVRGAVSRGEARGFGHRRVAAARTARRRPARSGGRGSVARPLQGRQ
jgi:hypothetical protein